MNRRVKGEMTEIQSDRSGGNHTFRSHSRAKSLRSHVFTIDDERGPPVLSERRGPTTQARSDGG